MNHEFERFVGRTTGVLEKDSRFVGLAIAGSWASNEIDEFSDLDLVLCCANGEIPGLAGMRDVAASLGSLISSFSGEHVGEPTLLICLFDEGRMIHVDLKFESLEGLCNRPYDPVVVWERDSVVSDHLASFDANPIAPDPQWIEDRFWTWVHYAALRLGRAELFELVGFLGFIREQVLGPLALHAGGFPPFGVRKIEKYLPDFSHRLQKTVPEYDANRCYIAILASIDIYRELRAKVPGGVIVNEQAETASICYLKEVALKTHTLK
ncbi:MAG: aminoglycoside 6-adenylyltransferase [Woeseiaceae bacterium]|nr:aminoglycoside 6-adenylyltransferase [Woeseiaceae bacterium]